MTSSRWFWLSAGLVLLAGILLVSPSEVLASQESLENVDTTSELDGDNGSDLPSQGGINFLSLLTRGGWFMVPLLALSLFVVAVAFERFISLRRNRIFPGRFVRQLGRLSQSPGGLEPRAAYEVCQKFPSAAANVFKSLLVKVGRPQSELESAVTEASQRQATRMLQWVSWLSLAAAIAPLIGLLGTVWGITQAFYDTTQLVAGQNRAEALAEGIYTALVTTMFGLIIAIPAAILAHFFENRVVSIMNEVEEMIFNLMPQLERFEGKVRFSDVRSAKDSNRNLAPDDSESAAERRTPLDSPGSTTKVPR
ncbi:MAG: MotA/TolQ/ExbB proton channel family protein [Planctomycetota bacterium]